MDAPAHTFTVTHDDPFMIALPFDPRAMFGRARPPVVVAVNGHVYRSTVAIMRGCAFVPFRASHRAAAGIKPGAPFEVTLTLDTAPRTVDAPDDLRAALEAAGIWDRWTVLSYTHQREHVDAIGGAKRPETRARRIAACVAALSA